MTSQGHIIARSTVINKVMAFRIYCVIPFKARDVISCRDICIAIILFYFYFGCVCVESCMAGPHS